MILGKKVAVVLPAYNAEMTLEMTLREIPEIVDDVILVDDASQDNTVQLAKSLGIKHVIAHDKNKGYGGNQKTCYTKALSLGADIIIMLHPDYQYTPKLIESMVYLIARDVYPVVIGSRILGNGALKGGMPYYKYVFNRVLTLIQNILLGNKLSEYHTGYRAYSKTVLETVNYADCSDNFIFDNQMLSIIIYAGFDIAEITCPTKYFAEASSINLSNSIRYGFGVLHVSLKHFLQRIGLINDPLYQEKQN